MNFTQWVMENGHRIGSPGVGEDRLPNVEQTFKVGMRNKLFEAV
jgi:hypothetical protein